MSRTYGADNSGTLFDHIKQKKKFKLEGELAIFLDEHPSVISEIRNGRRVVNDTLLIKICEKMNMSVKYAKAHLSAGL